MADGGDISDNLKIADSLWDAEDNWKRRIDGFAVQHLLVLKNDVWLDDDEPPLTALEFKSRMKLESISISPDGGFTFWHDDGDLFWGHAIQISGSLVDGPTHADIPG